MLLLLKMGYVSDLAMEFRRLMMFSLRAEQEVYSSAIDYAREKVLFHISII